MSESSLQMVFFEEVDEYIQELKDSERAKVLVHLGFMREGDHSILHTKQLFGPIRELIVRQHRIVYFRKENVLYIASAFKKQSAKTPNRIIDHAKGLYKSIQI